MIAAARPPSSDAASKSWFICRAMNPRTLRPRAGALATPSPVRTSRTMLQSAGRVPGVSPEAAARPITRTVTSDSTRTWQERRMSGPRLDSLASRSRSSFFHWSEVAVENLNAARGALGHALRNGGEYRFPHLRWPEPAWFRRRLQMTSPLRRSPWASRVRSWKNLTVRSQRVMARSPLDKVPGGLRFEIRA